MDHQDIPNTNKRAPARTLEDLLVWQKAHQWVRDLCSDTSPFRRAALSIPANITEGFKGSLEECRYYVLLSRDLQYGENPICISGS